MKLKNQWICCQWICLAKRLQVPSVKMGPVALDLPAWDSRAGLNLASIVFRTPLPLRCKKMGRNFIVTKRRVLDGKGKGGLCVAKKCGVRLIFTRLRVPGMTGAVGLARCLTKMVVRTQ